MMKIRALCHLHSTWSYDGRWPLKKLVCLARVMNSRVLLMTEHQDGFDELRWQEYKQACNEANTQKVLVVPGLEYNDSSNTVHFLVWGNESFLGVNLDADQILERVEETGGVAVFAHPCRRDAWARFESSWNSRLLGVEVWNRKMDGFAPSAKALELVSGASSLTPFVGCDFHNARQIFPVFMNLELDGDVCVKSVYRALSSGRCCPSVAGLPIAFYRSSAGYAFVNALELCRKKLLRKR